MIENYADRIFEPWGGDYIKAHMDFKDENGNLLLKKGDIMKYSDFRKLPIDTSWRLLPVLKIN